MPWTLAASTSGMAPSTLMMVRIPMAASVWKPASPSGTLPETKPSWYATALWMPG